LPKGCPLTTRRQHLAEMQYALAHNLPLPEARRRLAAERVRAAEAAFRNVKDAPLISGRELARQQRRAAALPTTEIANGDAPWMMRD
jgi:phage terminase Nu1 subunit (DNA packaging protein)